VSENEVPLLSKPAKASAALLVISSTIPAPEDRRAHLIREMVNLGWDDDDAVEFLALVAMPLDLLEETLLFLTSVDEKWQAKRRQRFFQFANDMFHDHLRDQAVVAVRNGMKIASDDNPKFFADMKERSDYLRERHGIDLTQELDAAQSLTATALMALMAGPLSTLGGAEEYGIIKDDALAALAVEAGEDYPELIRHILERTSLDVELLSSLMNSPASAVAVGVL
jgi:hypothetical protein